MRFRTLSGVIFDMDGVLWRGDQPLDGLAELFRWLAESALPYALATNNSSKTPADYVAKLERMGVSGVPPERIVTAGTATAEALKRRYPAGTTVYVVGMGGIRQALDEAGFDLLPDDASAPPAQVVVCGVDFALTYDKLRLATLHIRRGADFYGTNPDRTFPTPEGLVPGAGSLLAALVAATDVTPTVIGKPHPPMFEMALAMLNAPAENVLMVGDRLDTDIQGAQAVGLRTALLLTGVTTPEMLATSDIWADVAYEDLPALLRAWAGDDWWQAQVRARRQRR